MVSPLLVFPDTAVGPPAILRDLVGMIKSKLMENEAPPLRQKFRSYCWLFRGQECPRYNKNPAQAKLWTGHPTEFLSIFSPYRNSRSQQKTPLKPKPGLSGAPTGSC